MMQCQLSARCDNPTQEPIAGSKNMAKTSTASQPAPAKLTVPRSEAAAKLDERITIGEALLAKRIDSKGAFESVRHDYYTWSEYNRELLTRIFDTSQYQKEYDAWGAMSGTMNPTLNEEVARLQEDIASDCRKLRSLRDRLNLIDEVPVVARAAATSAPPAPSTNVFIVHGHDNALKQEVARFVEKLGLRAIILAEQANAGNTIIEKFEQHAEKAGFAIVLLTPDDVGGAKAAQGAPMKSRARQNVILELGYFIGSLGRARVCAIYVGDVELPSDIHGVLYVSAESDWRLPLAREMKMAKLPVDMNKALE
ncbi:MAG: nucleotide-binding protein [Fimbriimonadaceae bacterium]|nr:nucleotide-binding protein [Fimbriimonadaceae bacterium]